MKIRIVEVGDKWDGEVIFPVRSRVLKYLGWDACEDDFVADVGYAGTIIIEKVGEPTKKLKPTGVTDKSRDYV